ncbi:hypothetical protein ACA910_012589 [Epithemia clementina (nom. ined.)]
MTGGGMMGIAAAAASLDASSCSRHASVDRWAEWNWCCMEALGLHTEEDRIASFSSSSDVAPTKRSPLLLPRTDVILVNLMNHNNGKHKKVNQRRTGIQLRKPNENLSSLKHEQAHMMVWQQAIAEIQDNMNRMIAWLHDKAWTYLQPQTSDQEASLIQSTISSYTVTTANELENLRRHYQQQQMQQDNNNSAAKSPTHAQQQQHDMTVIQILSERLKERVAEPFQKLQKQRQRAAVQVWQNPLSCRFVASLRRHDDDDDDDYDNDNDDARMDRVLGLTHDDRDHENNTDSRRQFLPKRPRHVRHHETNFLDSYSTTTTTTNRSLSQRPKTLERLMMMKRPRSSSSQDQSNHHHLGGQVVTNPAEGLPQNKRSKAAAQQLDEQPRSEKDKLPSLSAFHHHEDDYNNNNGGETMDYVVDLQDLEQEAVLLQAQQNRHELDAVQTMETTMIQITTLLSQFSELVSSQQEEVWQIHDAVATSKQNVTKGQEELVDAAHRTQQSKHYMASAITAMGIALLVFHWIRP